MNADPIADMLTRIRNANVLRYEVVTLPASKINAGIAEIMKREGFISDARVEDRNGKKTLVLNLKFGPNGLRTITNLKRISKPGLRVYAPADRIPSVLHGLGVAILSTPNGLLTDKQARKANVGGEVFCYFW